MIEEEVFEKHWAAKDDTFYPGTVLLTVDEIDRKAEKLPNPEE